MEVECNVDLYDSKVSKLKGANGLKSKWLKRLLILRRSWSAVISTVLEHLEDLLNRLEKLH
jgi:hypothetical protein